jgi:transposase
MSKGKSDKPIYKPYEQDQLELIPPSADDLIPAKHLVRIVNQTIDEMNVMPALTRNAKGGGASRYHPLMMLKVLVYGYVTKVYSSRQLAKHVRENINFRWLSGCQNPDFRTINTFRSSTLKPVIDEVFIACVKLIAAKGRIKMENYFVDGTKIEANANKYTFVWGKAVKTNETKMDLELRKFLREIDSETEAENALYGNDDLEEADMGKLITSEEISAAAAELNRRLTALDQSQPRTTEIKKKLQNASKKINGDYLTRKLKYESYRAILGNRRSFSKTDPDATFMRMKEDHMMNGQLKPGYNVQIGTENGFVLLYDIFPNPNDTLTLKPHLEHFKKKYGALPPNIIADAGYGSEENYHYLENHGSKAFVKYNWFHKEHRKAFKKQWWRTENWDYDGNSDTWTCPQGHNSQFIRKEETRTESGFTQTLHRYRIEGCGSCPVKEQCTKAKGNREIQVNHELRRLKAIAAKRLTSEEGIAYRKRRCIEVEPVFAQIKENGRFRRFNLRGNEKVSVEWGLLCLGQNIKKLMTTG